MDEKQREAGGMEQLAAAVALAIDRRRRAARSRPRPSRSRQQSAPMNGPWAGESRRSTDPPPEILGTDESMSRYTIEIDGIEYSVEILEDTGSEARVVVNDRELRVSVTDEASPSSPPQQPWIAPIRPPIAPRVASGELRAPMPSRVTEVLVSTGDKVEEGQLLLKLEAMKMENQVLSPIAGTVEKLCVSSGQEVDGGQLLVKVSPS